MDHIMVETQVQGNAGRKVVVQIELAEVAFLSVVACQPVELVIERLIIPHRQAPRLSRGDQSTGATMAAHDVLDRRLSSAPNTHAVVIDPQAAWEEAPKLLL